MKKVIFVFFIALAISNIADAQSNNKNLDSKENIYASINNKISGEISVDELLNNSIAVSKINSTVTCFTFSFLNEAGEIVEQQIKGNKIGLLSDNVKNELIKAKKVFIDKIVVHEVTGRSFKLPALIFTIKK